jgi:hypothetical protein
MNNCKIKYRIGISLIILNFCIIFLKDIFKTEEYWFLFLLYMLISFVLAFKWIRKYMICLQNYNNKHSNASDSIIW